MRTHPKSQQNSGHRNSLLIIGWLMFMLFPVSVWANVSLIGRVDRNRITIYERISYSLTIEANSRKIPEPISPNFNGFKVLGVPRTSTQISWVNGRTTNTRVYTYSLEAKAEGEYVIGPAKITIDGQVYLSKPIKIIVSKPGQARVGSIPDEDNLQNTGFKNMGDLFLRSVVDKDSPFVGEPITLSYFLYTRVKIRDYGLQEQPDYQGFWVEPVELPLQPVLISRKINGVEYGEAKIHEVVLYPTVTGELTIPPLTMILKVQSRQRDPFNDFFGSSFRSGIFGSRREIRSSQAMTIHVKPLPLADRPTEFSGAVGDFQIKASINNTEVKTGDAVVIRVTLKGRHGLQTLSSPVAPQLDQFKLFDPKSEDIVPDPANVGWSMKTWEYILVPHQPGEFLIPAFRFSYFDSEAIEYREIKTESFLVKVEAMPGSGVSVKTGNDGEEIRLLNVDIRYIKTGGSVSSWKPSYTRGWFIIVMILPVIFVPGMLVIIRRKRRLEGDSAFAREVRARSVSGRRFASARKHIAEGYVDKALDDAAAAFGRYLSDRLGLPLGGVTVGNVMEVIAGRDISDTVKDEIKTIWEKLDAARYAPVKNENETAIDLIRDVQKLVDILEKCKLRKQCKGKQSGGRS